MFDPEKFTQTEYKDSLSTAIPPVPEGEYIAMIDKLDWDTVDTKNGKRLQAIAYWEIDDAQGIVKAATKLDKNTVRQTIWLDLTPDSNIENGQISLDMGEGRNVDLGRLREALGQNQAGRPWKFDMLKGVPARILVKQRMYEGRTFTDVKGVSKL